MPSENARHFVEVFYQAGDPAFVYGMNGQFTTADIEDIEKDLFENPDMYFKENGTYLFEAKYQNNEPEDGGPHYELEKIRYVNTEPDIEMNSAV